MWQGRYSMMNDGFSWILWFLFAGVSAFAAFKWLTLREPLLRWVFACAVLLPAVILVIASFIRRLSVRYRLTTHR
ncbi:MAG TPA: hypothetical protein VFT32_09200, partial [Candidatus Eisenbacteria bacterium]|nr:hypothetical protein [Candidatus Eisenbacteria bacterium]